jgi:tripartite-type tricarboxylate transporter receptor subunit TctC
MRAMRRLKRGNATMPPDRLLRLRCSRRDIVGAAATLAALAGAGSFPAQAQAAYPNKPIRLLCGFAAGGPTDIIARVVGQKLGEILGQQVYVENRAGASGNLATEAAARAEPDGYTIMLTPLSSAVNESLFKTLKVKFDDDLAAVGLLAQTALVLLVHPSLEIKSVGDLVTMAKAKPGDVLYASAGKGTATHLAAELFNATANIKTTPVHYKGGGETIKDLLSGQGKVMFSTIPPVVSFVKDGRLRGIATTGPKRDNALPELPTIAESGLPGYDVRLWFGVTAPKATPRPIIDRLSAAINQALDSADVKKSFAAQGYDALPGTPDEFAKFYRSEAAKWAKVIETVGSIGD